MWSRALFYGFIAGGALLLGALAGIYLKPGRKYIAMIMGFGAGVLICALTFDLMEEAYSLGGFDSVTLGFLAGALLYVVGDWFVSGHGGHARKYTLWKRHLAYRRTKTLGAKGTEGATEGPKTGSGAAGDGSGMAIFVGALLDGIPESAAIGLGLATGEGFGLLMLIAVFISNFPEGISGAAGMLASGRSKRFVFWMWGGVTAICALSSLWGYVSLAHAAPDTIAFMLALAAGAILAMISATMIPEAFDDEGRLIPVAVPMATVLGFLAAFIVSRLTT